MSSRQAKQPSTTRRRWFDATRERIARKKLFNGECEIYGNSPTAIHHPDIFTSAVLFSLFERASEWKKLSSETRRKLHSLVCYKCDFDDLLGVEKICFSLKAALASPQKRNQFPKCNFKWVFFSWDISFFCGSGRNWKPGFSGRFIMLHIGVHKFLIFMMSKHKRRESRRKRMRREICSSLNSILRNEFICLTRTMLACFCTK